MSPLSDASQPDSAFGVTAEASCGIAGGRSTRRGPAGGGSAQGGGQRGVTWEKATSPSRCGLALPVLRFVPEDRFVGCCWMFFWGEEERMRSVIWEDVSHMCSQSFADDVSDCFIIFLLLATLKGWFYQLVCKPHELGRLYADTIGDTVGN